MKRILAFAIAALLAGCGGGGGGGGSAIPPAPPAPTYANTSSTYYLPMTAGNSWTFNSGGSIQDLGQGALTCSCAINGAQIEQLKLVNPDGSSQGQFYYTKTISNQTGGVLTTLIGIGYTGSTSIQLVTDGTNYGLPVMDDKAFAGESWSYPTQSSQITAVNGTQAYGNGQIIRNVNTDSYSGSANFLWSFGQGVGFTSITLQGQTITLTSFTVNATTSKSHRAPQTLTLGGMVTPADAAAMMRGLF